MNSFRVLLKKEARENIRNYKVLWIPIVFILFGILEPITNHFLPEIMKSIGNMPEGAEFIWPELQGEDIFISLLGQYQLIGMLVIILAFMGSISGERKSGTATLLYVRPISFWSYFLSKWIVVNAIVLGSVWLGFMASWYYIEVLFNSVDVGHVLLFMTTYSLWILFVVTIVLVLSASLPTGAAAGVAILITLVFQIIDSLLGQYWKISPWKLPLYATQWFQGDMNMQHFWLTVFVTILLIIVLIFFGITMSKRNSAKTTI